MKHLIWLALAAFPFVAWADPATDPQVMARAAGSPLGNDYLETIADFDGDGLDDRAYFTPGADGYDIWIKRAAEAGPVKVATIPANSLGLMGLSSFPAGDYESPCNADIRPECGTFGSITFTIENTALAVFEYEIGQTMVYWRGDQFVTAYPFE